MPFSKNTYRIQKIAFAFLAAALFTACSSTASYQKNASGTAPLSDSTDQVKPIYSVYLIGDAGAASRNPRSTVLKELEKQLKRSGENSAVIFLGDNIYPHGLPPSSSPKRERAERRLLAQLNTVKEYPGQLFFIPGNHDWNSSGRNGLPWIRRQERYIESYLERGNVFLPDSGYPGPVNITLNSESRFGKDTFRLNLILLDTQWWLHPHEKPVQKGVDGIEQQKQKMAADLREMIDNSGDSEVIVAAHHPLVSYGRHGGKFPVYRHFLPPVLGSMYVAYRKIWGYKQDVKAYPELKEMLQRSFSGKEELIYASGHEHSLQFIPTEGDQKRHYYLVSGSGSKSSFVKKMNDDVITHRGKGFLVIHYYREGTKKIEFWDRQGNLIAAIPIGSN